MATHHEFCLLHGHPNKIRRLPERIPLLAFRSVPALSPIHIVNHQ